MGVARAVGLGVGLAVGFAVGLGVGFGVGLGVGLGVGFGAVILTVAGLTVSSVTTRSPWPLPDVARNR